MSLTIINDVNDISALSKESDAVLATKHLFIQCNYGGIREALLNLIEEKGIFSVLFQSSGNNEFVSDAHKIETVPFFLVADEKDAIALIADLIKDPINVGKNAINGEAVAIRYAEGFSS